MHFGDYSTPLLAILSTIVVGVAGAIVPIINAELFVVFLGAIAPRPLLVVLVLVMTAAHMTGKAILYWAGRSANGLGDGWLRARVDRARERLQRFETVGVGVVFTSAVTGVPPLYVISVASGVFRLHLATFLATGFAGRLIRFGVIAAFPQVVRSWFG